MIPAMAPQIYELIGRLVVSFVRVRYELIGRIVVWVVRTRYRTQLRIAAGVGVAAALLGGYLAATREPPEG
jgi:hypothetical protein